VPLASFLTAKAKIKMAVARSSWRIVEETLPVILVFSLLELFTGGFLNFLMLDASALPGLLILVPGMLGLRGNISSALGARLCSGLHLGYISAKGFSKGVRTNMEISIILSTFMSLMLAVFAWLVCSFTSPACMGLAGFVTVSVMTGILSGVFLSVVTASIAIFSCRHGLDPDNTTLPSSASIGDIVTIVCLILSVKVVMGLGI
jgi:mgtE-like transporter